MKKILKNLPYAIIPILLLIFIFRSNDTIESEIIQINPEYAKYISAYTSGVISKKSDIVIELKEDLSNDDSSDISINSTGDELFKTSSLNQINARINLEELLISFSTNEDLNQGKSFIF